VRLYDIKTGSIIWSIYDEERGTGAAAISPDGRFIAVAGNTLVLRSVDDGHVVREYAGAKSNVYSRLRFSPDGRLLVLASTEGLQVWDVETGVMLQTYAGFGDWLTDASFTADSTHVVASSIDKTARIIDLATNQEIRYLSADAGPVTAVIFSPDERYVITAHEDNSIRLWYADRNEAKAALCARLLRDFTPEERAQYGIADDTPTCPR
jgi:WD40 repeat protein